MSTKSCFRMISGKEVKSHGGLAGLIKHDLRESVSTFKNIRSELRAQNGYHIVGRPIEDILAENARIVKSKTGRKMQANALTLRECIMELPEDWDKERINDMVRVCREVITTPIYRYYNELEEIDGKNKVVSYPLLDEEGHHIKSPLELELVAVIYHGDEGHWVTADGNTAGLAIGTDGKWHDAAGMIHDPKTEGLTWKVHHHCHPWYNCLDRNTGKSIRLASEELSQIQTLVAKRLGMERGIKGSNRARVSTEEYSRMQQIEAEIGKMEEECLKRQNELETLQEKKKVLNVELEQETEKLALRKRNLKMLRSYGLLKLIESIPNLIKHDLGVILSRYYIGKIKSFEISGEKVRFHMESEKLSYRLDVSKIDGSVFINGNRRVHNGEFVYIKEIPEYFNTALNQEARDMVESLYKSSKQTIDQQQNTSGPRIKR